MQCQAMKGGFGAWELTFPQCVSVCAVKFIPPLEYSTPAVFNALHQGVH